MTTFRSAANLSLLFGELPLLSRPAAAAAAGFAAVESWWPFSAAVPDDAEIERWVTAVSDAGVALIGLNFFGGNMAAGERGIMTAPHRASEFRDNVDVAVGIASRLGCTAFNALHGRYVDGTPIEAQQEMVLANVQVAATAAATIGAWVGIEPISAIPDFPIRTARDAADLVDRARTTLGLDNVMIWGDLYHLTANGDDVETAIEVYGAQMRHVQIADFPGRHEPGSGQVDLLGHLRHLAAVGYSGYVGLEFIPSTPSTADALARTMGQPGYAQVLDLVLRPT
jgi:hydroxypyruvate isomerase